jgi:hypothetical protein
MSRTAEEPQWVDSSQADAEWSVNYGLDNVIHGTDSKVNDF